MRITDCAAAKLEKMKITLSLIVFLSASLLQLASSKKRERKAPPPPHHHPPPPDITTAASTTESTTAEWNADPQPLSEGQCSLGVNSTLSSPDDVFTTLGWLYVDFGQAAPCSGVVTRLELCYSLVEGDENGSFYFAVLRYNQIREGYETVGVRMLGVSLELQTNTNNKRCGSVGIDHSTMLIQEGDFIGFLSEDVRMAMIYTTSQGVSSVSMVGRDTRNARSTTEEDLLLEDTFLLEDEFGARENAVPLIRVIINSSEVITTLFTDAPTTMNATEQETEADHINNRDIVQSVIYITTVAVASFIIVMLLAIILCMGCCICYQNGCRRRERVTHTIRVEPLSEQSMQYNDLYVPTDPNQIITRGQRESVNFERNPAYFAKDTESPAVTRNAPQGDNDHHYETSFSINAGKATSQSCLVDEASDPKDLDHTYELIKSLKLASS